MRYCGANGLPPLTVVVVNAETGGSGAGLTGIENQNVAREAVFNYDWYAIKPPTAEELSVVYP